MDWQTQKNMIFAATVSEWTVLIMSEWISVKDRLPEDNQRAIVYRPEMSESDVGAVSVQFGWNCKRKKTDITHWMPLPEPPKEDVE